MIDIEAEKDKVIASIRYLMKIGELTQKSASELIGVQNDYFSRVLNKRRKCTLDSYYEYYNKLEKIVLKSTTN